MPVTEDDVAGLLAGPATGAPVTEDDVAALVGNAPSARTADPVAARADIANDPTSVTRGLQGALESTGAIPPEFNPREEEEALKDAKLKAIQQSTWKWDIEQRAKELKLSRQTGVPAEVVSADYANFKAMWDHERFDWRGWRGANPDLAKLALDNPSAAPLMLREEQISVFAKAVRGIYRLEQYDDAQREQTRKSMRTGQPEVKLKRPDLYNNPDVWMRDDPAASQGPLEKISAAKAKADKGIERSKLGAELALRMVRGQDTAEIEGRIAKLGLDLEPTYLNAGPLTSVAIDAANILPSLVETMKTAGAGAVVGGAIGAAAGYAGGKKEGAVKLGLAGARVGSRLGSGGGSFRLEMGGALVDMLGEKTDDGRPMDRNVALGSAIAYGVVAGTIEAVSFGHEASMFGPLGDAIRKGTGKAFMKGMIKDATFRKVFKDIALRYAKGVAGEVGEEVSQEASADFFDYVARSLTAGRLQKVNPEAELVGLVEVAVSTAKGITALAPGMAVQNTATQLGGQRFAKAYGDSVDRSDAQKGGELIASVLGLGESPTVQAAPAAVAQMVADVTSETGQAVTHLYLGAGEFVRYFQDRNEDPAEAAVQMLGPEGPRVLQEALATGGKLEVPMADYLEKWGGTEAAKALAEDTTTQRHHDTAREAKAKAEEAKADQAQVQELAKEIAKEYEAEAGAPAAEPTFERQLGDKIERQLISTGQTPQQARTSAVLARAFIRTQAQRNGVKPEDVFAGLGGLEVGKGDDAAAAPEGALPQDSEFVAQMREAFGALSPEDQKRAVYLDRNTKLLNARGFELVQPDPARPLLAEFDLEGGKFLNDAHGHESFDGALRVMGGVLSEHVPDGAKLGGALKAWVSSPEQAQQIADAMSAKVGDGIRVTTATGADKDAAGKAHRAAKDADVKAGKLGHRKGAPAAFTHGAPAIAFDPGSTGLDPKSPEAKAILAKAAQDAAPFAERMKASELGKGAQLTEAHAAAFEKDKDAAFETVHREPTGLLTDDGFALAQQLRLRAFTASADMRGLGPMNEERFFGKKGADEILRAFSEALAELGGAEFDAAHPHGDEFFAQADDRKALDGFFEDFRETLNTFVFFAEKSDGSVVVQERVHFVHGTGASLDEADRIELPKAKLKQGDVAGPVILTAEQWKLRRAELEASHHELFDVQRAVEGRSAGGQGEAAGQEVDRLHQSETTTPGPVWHSAAERAATTAKQKAGDAASWLAVVSKTPGVKKEELEFLGLEDWLKEQKGTITREQVAEYIKANRIEVREKVLGEPGDISAYQQHQDDITLRLRLKTLEEYGVTVDQTDEGVRFRTADGLEGIEEIAGSLADRNVSRDGIQELRESAESIERISRERAKGQVVSDPTEYGKYVTAGAAPDSYRELLFYAPGAEGYKAPHFQEGEHEKGLTAHARFSEHTTADGAKVLLIEEVQSDLHQAGREQGYADPKALDAKERVRRAEVALVNALEARGVRHVQARDAALDVAQGRSPGAGMNTKVNEVVESDEGKSMSRELRDAYLERAETGDPKGVPDAPFKDTWEAMVVRRLVRWAAEKGYTKIAWTTGQEQADRYGLAKQVDSLKLVPYLPGSPAAEAGAKYQLVATKDGRRVATHDIKSEDELPAIIGKETANKLLASKPGLRVVTAEEAYGDQLRPSGSLAGRWAVLDDTGDIVFTGGTQDEATAYAAKENEGKTGHALTGEDLKLGGDGMKVAYDKRIPGIVDKLIKKTGGKVGKEKLAAGRAQAQTNITNTDIWQDDYSKKWTLSWFVEGSENLLRFDTQEEAEAARDDLVGEGPEEPGPEVWTATLPAALRAQAMAEGMPLFQDTAASEGPRGYTEFARSGLVRVFKVALNKNADLSTFLHESGHVFLETFGDLADRPDAPQGVKDDWAATLKWMGVAARSDIEREHHEKWARGFEAYLLTGKAPSARLEAAFQRFKLWLTNIYKSITSLNVELSPEITGVFDRLLATDEEIARTKQAMGLQPIFRSPEAARMDPEQWQAYLAQQERATAHGARQAELTALKDRLRETESWWKEAEAEQRELAEADYAQIPAVRANEYTQKGVLTWRSDEGVVRETNFGGRPTLDRAAVVEAVGKERAKRFLIAKEGGIHPDEVGELFGFPTGKAALEAILARPERTAWVDAAVAERMEALHPDVLQERTQLRELVSAGLHGEHTAKWLLTEWAALRQKAGQGPAPVEAIKKAATMIAERRAVGRLEVGGALAAERSAAEKAAKAAVKKDYAQAAIFKQQQLLSMYLHGELTRARDEREAFLELAGKLSEDKARARLGKAGPVYRDGVDMLLEAFELKEAAERDEQLPSLGEVTAAMQADGATVMFDSAVLGRLLAQPRDWKTLNLTEMRTVNDALRNLQGAARAKATALVDGKRADKAEVIAEMLTDAAKNLPSLGPLPSSESARTLAEKVGGLWSLFDGSLLKIETMANWLANDDLKSPWFRAIIKPLQDAKAREVDLLNQTVKPILEAFEAMPKGVRSRFQEKVDGAKLFPEHAVESGQNLAAPTRRYELLMMALNAGNESNLSRLLEGRNITEAQLHTALDLLTKEEMDWVQSVWDANESLWPEAAAMEERDSGLPPEKIKLKPLETRHGTYAGGYFAAVYDRRVEAVGETQQANAVAALMDPSFTRPATARGHLKSRSQGFTGALSLEPSAIPAHLAQVVHDIAFREAVKSVGGLVMDQSIQATLKDRLGDERAKQFLQWLKDIGTMRGVEGMTHSAALLKGVRSLRANTVIAALGYAAPNMIEDLSNLPAAVARTDLKAKHLAAALAEFTASPRQTAALAHEKSGELRTRREQLQRELGRQVKKLTAKGPLSRGPLEFVKHHAFALMEASDWATSTPVWLGAYRQALAAGELEADAITKADSTVRKVFPSHSAVDTAAVLRDKGFIGTTMTFYGFLNTYYNGLRDLQHQFGKAEGVADKARVGGQMVALVLAVGVLSEFLRGRGKEPEEEWQEWFLRKSLLSPLTSVPFGGDAANAIEAKAMGKKSNPRNNSLVGTALALGEALWKAADDEKDGDKRVKELLRAIGPLTGLPISQPIRTGGYLKDVLDGEATARNPADFASGLIYGEKEGQPANPLNMLGDAISGER